MSKTAIVTGVTGQTASYLLEHLLNDSYIVYGVIRRSSTFNTERIEHLLDHPNFRKVYGDLSDSSSLSTIIGDIKPDFFYNLGAQSHVRISFDLPEFSSDVDGLGVIRCLESIRKLSPKTRFYQASSSELFGASPPPQNETTPFYPRSPYAIAKLMGYWATVNYREAYNIFASNGILFNHESTRRGENFVTRKITRSLGRIYYNLQDTLSLGNLNSRRDWGHACEYAQAIKMILEHDSPNDFVIATGKSYSVKDFVEKAFSLLNLDPYKYIKIDPVYYRPTEVNFLHGDYSKANKAFGWEPKITFDELVKEMVEHDLELARQEKLIKDNPK